MAANNDTGKWGEDLACRFLESQGYAIVERNWRSGKLEADIIAYHDGTFIFVEVKTRKDASHGEPETFVTRQKQRAYLRLADQYVRQNRRQEEVRFDIVAITPAAHDGQPDIRHFPNAFNAISAMR